MTHLTGPRSRVVRALSADIHSAIGLRKATVSEAFEAMHEVGMTYIHQMLKPYEADCPTCPKPRKQRSSHTA